jgi:hypothetical protein
MHTHGISVHTRAHSGALLSTDKCKKARTRRAKFHVI